MSDFYYTAKISVGVCNVDQLSGSIVILMVIACYPDKNISLMMSKAFDMFWFVASVGVG